MSPNTDPDSAGEDNPGDARLIREMLAETEGQEFSVDWVSRLAEGLESLSQGPDRSSLAGSGFAGQPGSGDLYQGL